MRPGSRSGFSAHGGDADPIKRPRMRYPSAMSSVIRAARSAFRSWLFPLAALLLCTPTVFGRSSPQALKTATPWPDAAPGLPLPVAGSVWVLDHEAGQTVLVHLGYMPTRYNGHGASNFFREQAEPFIYRPKGTVEISGATAKVRLHDLRPVFFMRDTNVDAVSENEAPNQPTNTQPSLSLVTMKTKKDMRILSSISYAPWGGHAKRAADAVAMDVKTLPENEWVRWQPLQDLKPGEYGITTLPHGQGLFPDRIYDFAIDPSAPPNPDTVKPRPTPGEEKEPHRLRGWRPLRRE